MANNYKNRANGPLNLAMGALLGGLAVFTYFESCNECKPVGWSDCVSEQAPSNNIEERAKKKPKTVKKTSKVYKYIDGDKSTLFDECEDKLYDLYEVHGNDLEGAIEFTYLLDEKGKVTLEKILPETSIKSEEFVKKFKDIIVDAKLDAKAKYCEAGKSCNEPGVYKVKIKFTTNGPKEN